MSITLRRATLDDRPAITRLIELSARGLSREDYSEEQIEGAIAGVFGVDSDLIHDGTYFVAEASNERLYIPRVWSYDQAASFENHSDRPVTDKKMEITRCQEKTVTRVSRARDRLADNF